MGSYLSPLGLWGKARVGLWGKARAKWSDKPESAREWLGATRS
jgi:hypothetical protein